MDTILYSLNIIQYQQKHIRWFLHFICRYIPLKQWAFDDSHSPKYQKFKVDKLPRIISYQQDWTWKDLIPYYKERYGKVLKPVFRRVKCNIPDDCTCVLCAKHLSTTLPGITENPKHKSYARFAGPDFLLVRIIVFLKHISLDALTVLMP